jgi:hypothetical protein
MTLKEASKHALTILKQVMEEKLNATNIEVINFLYDNNPLIIKPSNLFIISDVHYFSQGQAFPLVYKGGNRRSDQRDVKIINR